MPWSSHEVHLQANEAKLRLEQKQRAARKAAEEGVPLEPRWFESVPGARWDNTLFVHAPSRLRVTTNSPTSQPWMGPFLQSHPP